MQRHRILLADDEEASRTGLHSLLSSWGYEVAAATDGQEALEKAETFVPEVVIADLVMPKLDGLELLSELQHQLPSAMVIILTGHGTIETAVTAVKEGVYDYLEKPVDVRRLRLLIPKALRRADTLREVTVLRKKLKEVWGSGGLVGKSAAMREVYRQIDLAAPTSAPILIWGESGVGKEVAARTIHDLSPHGKGPFVAVNCAAIPETLLESEMFGHEQGAFTGALEQRAGCFELARDGTIFLDEVGEMNPSTQAKFLRILQDGTVRRLGGAMETAVDVRVVAATNKDPMKAVKDGTLREDLYYRLNVFNIALPPLRDRREDIPLLVQAFVEEFNAKYDKRVKSVDNATLHVLGEHSWPGNVRELRNTIERAIIVCDAELIAPRHLSPSFTGYTRPSGAAVSLPIGMTLAEFEKQLILKTLESAGNNKTRAAKILGISLRTLHNRLGRYRGRASRPTA
jgi:DNA-binding NtrC family response regulator